MKARWMWVAALAACASDPDPSSAIEAHYTELANNVHGDCGTFNTSVPVEACAPPASDVSGIVTCLQNALTSGGEGTASGSVKFYNPEDMGAVSYTGEAHLFVTNGKVTEFSQADGTWYERHCQGIGLAFESSQCPRVTGVGCDD